MSGKKHKHAPHENLERWVVSYADFMTLLFATFTALYALAKAESSTAEKEVMNGIRQGFQDQSLMHGVKSLLSASGKGAPTNITNLASPDRNSSGDGVMGDFKSLVEKKGQTEVEQPPSGEEGLNTIAQELNKELEGLQKAIEAAAAAGEGSGGEGKLATERPNGQGNETSPDIEVERDKRGVRLRINSRVLFGSGAANLRPQAQQIIAMVAAKLKPMAVNYLIQVEGHTDNQAIRSVQYPSNWELSTARASAVVRYLIQSQGFNSHQLSAAGFAETQPLKPNATAQGRNENRRIEFLLYTDPNRVKTPAEKPKKTLVIKPHGEAAGVEISPKVAAADLSSQSSGSFVPKALPPKPNRLQSQLVLSETSDNSSQGPARVVIQRTDTSNGQQSHQMVPARPMVEPSKPNFMKSSGH
ncbi:MAG: OmpA family protein [Vampirovibrionales bacterium]|nr:OmpA family protein [Vampirovibrionales bacterium]